MAGPSPFLSTVQTAELQHTWLTLTAESKARYDCKCLVCVYVSVCWYVSVTHVCVCVQCEVAGV